MVNVASSKPGIIKPDPDLARISQQRKVTENDLLMFLRGYNLIDALYSFGVASSHVHFAHDENKVSKSAYYDQPTGLYITQHMMAYYACMLILSHGSDDKGKPLGNNIDNLRALCSIYDDKLADPFREAGEDEARINDAYSWLVRTAFDQLSLQFLQNYLLARNLMLFCDLAGESETSKLGSFDEVFLQQAKLPIDEFLKIAFTVYAALMSNPPFVNTASYTMANVPGLKVNLSGKRVMDFIKVLHADYNLFRADDLNRNRRLNKEFTKSRYNPLLRFPIIKPDAKVIGKMFIIPNTPIYVLRAFGGFFWWFDDYYKDKGLQEDYRRHFGTLFQDYVGLVLQGIYGEKNVNRGFPYGPRKQRRDEFGDWYVVRKGKLYLFEVKAVQFSLLSRQTGNKNLIVKNELPKITKAIVQLFKRARDIDSCEELERFRGMKVFPVAVFYDIPTPLERVLNDWIKVELERIEKEENLTGLSQFSYYCLDIKQLELYDGCADLIDLDDAFSDLWAGDSFQGRLVERKGNQLNNRMLDKRLSEFLDTIASPPIRNVGQPMPLK